MGKKNAQEGVMTFELTGELNEKLLRIQGVFEGVYAILSDRAFVPTEESCYLPMLGLDVAEEAKELLSQVEDSVRAYKCAHKRTQPESKQNKAQASREEG